jgi:hypothetical protein
LATLFFSSITLLFFRLTKDMAEFVCANVLGTTYEITRR